MHLQDVIHRLTVGAGSRGLALLAALLGFLALAVAYDLHGYRCFTSAEAMETAQVARNLAEGKGFTTQTIHPLDLCLLQKQSPGSAKNILDKPFPDLGHAPLYPAVLAAFFKVLPEKLTGPFGAPHDLEFCIVALNQAFFFLAALLLFKIASDLFDKGVAWLATAVFVGADLFWQFSASGLSTLLGVVLFLAIVGCLSRIEKRSQNQAAPGAGGVFLALVLGVLVGLASLTSYSFICLLLPVLLYIGLGTGQGRAKLCLAALFSFAVVMTPWLMRNFLLSGNLFGTASYSIFQNTPPFPGDTLERSFDLKYAMSRIDTRDYVDKLMVNSRLLFSNDLPKLGGSWVSAFFLVGLLVPFRNPSLSKMRLFLLGSIGLLGVFQALGQTHLSTDAPEINSENLLVVAAPLALVFGIALFFTLLDQLTIETPGTRTAANVLFGAVACAPFLFVFLTPPVYPLNAAIDAFYIQRITRWTDKNELMASDVPAAVAWYGHQTCALLPLNNKDQFAQLNAFKPVHGLFLTQRTTDHSLAQTSKNTETWERFALDCWARGEVPDQFPLNKAPTGFLPDRIFLSDTNRWQAEASQSAK